MLDSNKISCALKNPVSNPVEQLLWSHDGSDVGLLSDDEHGNCNALLNLACKVGALMQ